MKSKLSIILLFMISGLFANGDLTDFAIVNISSIYDGETGKGIENLIDNDESTMFCTTEQTVADLNCGIMYELDKSYVLTGFSFTAGTIPRARDPKKVVVYGSDNGASLEYIDSLNIDNSKWSSQYYSEYFIDNDKAYQYYYFVIDNYKSEGLFSASNRLQLSEMQLFVEDYFYQDVTNIYGTEVYTEFDGDGSNLIDNEVSSYYSSGLLEAGTMSWVIVELPQAISLRAYGLGSASTKPQRDPKNVIVEGSNDGNNWVRIDSMQIDHEKWNRTGVNYYQVSEVSETYSQYKISMDNQESEGLLGDQDYVQISEVELYCLPNMDPKISVSKAALTFSQSNNVLSKKSLPGKSEQYSNSTAHGMGLYTEATFENSQNNIPDYNPAMLPESVDWRHYDTHVVNQGGCGSCYSFGACAYLEAEVNRMYENNVPGYGQIDLSEQEGKLRHNGCSGGGPDQILRYAIASGLGNEEACPYTEVDGTIAEISKYPDYQVTAVSYTAVTSDQYSGGYPTADDLKAVLQYGPFVAGINCPPDFGGLAPNDIMHDTRGGGAHAILMVGYNDNDGDGYFVIKNSWGTGWANGGYGKIGYDCINGDTKVGNGGYLAQGIKLVDYSQHFYVSNAGYEALEVSEIVSSADWLQVKTIGEVPFRINSYEEKAIGFEIDWSLVSGNESATLTIKSDDPEQPEMSIPVNITDYVKVDEGEVVAQDFQLGDNYPNPFNPSTRINFTIPKAQNVEVIIYNMLGEKVFTLANQSFQPGTYSLKWNGTDEAGHILPSGVYIYQMKTNSYIANKKMLFVK